MRPFALSFAFFFLASAIAQDSFPPKNDLPKDIKQLPNGDLEIGKIVLHRKQREISFPVRFVEASALEVIVATPSGRLHETLLEADISPLQLQTCLYLLGLNNGKRRPNQGIKQGDLVDLDVEWKDKDGTLNRRPVENWILDLRTGEKMKRLGWVFVGSGLQNGEFLANIEGNICINYSVGSTILDSPDPDSDKDTIHAQNKKEPFPPAETGIRLRIRPRKKTAPKK